MDIFQLLKEHKEDIEIWKSIASIATLFITLFLGVWIAKKVENIKLYALKEKEWQVKWADMFLKDAIVFNENVSNLVCYLDTWSKLRDENDDEVNKKIREYIKPILHAEWNIKNYTSFSSIYGNKVSEKQSDLIELLTNLVNNKGGDLEKIRRIQIEYNEFVRLAHSEILRLDT